MAKSDKELTPTQKRWLFIIIGLVCAVVVIATIVLSEKPA